MTFTCRFTIWFLNCRIALHSSVVALATVWSCQYHHLCGRTHMDRLAECNIDFYYKIQKHWSEQQKKFIYIASNKPHCCRMCVQATLFSGKEKVVGVGKGNAHLQRHFSISGTQNKWLLTIHKIATKWRRAEKTLFSSSPEAEDSGWMCWRSEREVNPPSIFDSLWHILWHWNINL